MRSDDSPPGADDQPPLGEPQRPAWLIWTIVGGAAALVAIAGTFGIIAVAKHRAPEATSTTAPPPGNAAVELLRAQMPADLQSAKECGEASPQSDATAYEGDVGIRSQCARWYVRVWITFRLQ